MITFFPFGLSPSMLSWVYHSPPFFSYLLGSGEGVWASIDKRPVKKTTSKFSLAHLIGCPHSAPLDAIKTQWLHWHNSTSEHWKQSDAAQTFQWCMHTTVSNNGNCLKTKSDNFVIHSVSEIKKITTTVWIQNHFGLFSASSFHTLHVWL